MRRVVCLLLVVLVGAPAAPTAAAAEPHYEAPVDGAVIDPFRPPATPYGPGNRGIDYGTTAGEEVRAANDGLVVFAGRVGLSLHVVVLHDDGVRTSYSFLRHVSVRRGDRVQRGDVVGLAGDELHFGARVGDVYIDPSLLLAGAPPKVHLVPAQARRAASNELERKGLVRSLIGGARHWVHGGARAVAWARDRAGDTLAYGAGYLKHQVVGAFNTARLLGYYTDPSFFALHLWSTAGALRRDQRGCTRASTPPKARVGGRHIALLVAGFGSKGGDAAILRLDTRALGYADTDVAQFSYRGGQAPGDRKLAGVPVNDYGAADSQDDITEAARRFRDLLETLRVTHPGTPIDIIAHSQGGLVVRAALGDDLDHLDPRLPDIDHVITLGTPHHGSDLADINASLGIHPVGQLAQAGVKQATHGGTDPWSDAAGQLSTVSSFSQRVSRRELPDGARFTSIAASGDFVVPATRAVLDGADNVVVGLTGLHAHDALPGSPQALREVRLALADQAPTCTNPGDALLGSAIATLEHDVGGLIAGGSVLAGRGR